MSTFSPTLAVFSAAALFVFYKAARLLLRPYFSPLRDLPGPPLGSYIFGHTKEIRVAMADPGFVNKWSEQYGNVMKINLLIGREAIFTLDTRAINHVLTHSFEFVKPAEGRRALARLLGDGVLVAEGDKHRQQRRIMNPSFAPASIKALTPIFFRKAILLRDVFAKLTSDRPSEPIEVLSWLSRATLDVIGLAGFNYQFDALNVDKEQNELNKAFMSLFHADRSLSLLEIVQMYFPLLRNLPTKRERGRSAAMSTMRRIGTELVDERKNAVLGGKQRRVDDGEREELVGRDLLSALVQANMDTDIPDHQRMNDEDVLSQVPTFLVAGHETTSTETMWALFSLSQEPEVQRKLRDELLGVPSDTLDMDELNALPYLDAVVRETLRLHAAVTFVSRVAAKDDVIPLSAPFVDKKGAVHNEIRVSKGNRVIIPILAINVHKGIWGEDSMEFKPDRWIHPPEAATHIPGVWGNMLTFLGGARSCIGYRFALIEMKALLFTLIRNFEFELAIPPERIEKRSFIVSRPYLKGDRKAGAQMPLIVKPCKGRSN